MGSEQVSGHTQKIALTSLKDCSQYFDKSYSDNQMVGGICLNVTDILKSINIENHLIVMGDNNNKYFYKTKMKHEESDHVEKQLIDSLARRGRGTNWIPPNSSIVIICPWSPCIQCTESMGDFLRTIHSHPDLGQADKKIQINFLFKLFYSKQDWPHDIHRNNRIIWKSNRAALDAYEEKCAELGTIQKKVRRDPNGKEDMVTVPRLVIARITT